MATHPADDTCAVCGKLIKKGEGRFLVKDDAAPIEAARLTVHSSRVVGHWITSSARDSNDGGIVSPSAFAVLRLMTSSNLVGCSIGRSPGLAPFRILTTYFAARRYRSG